MQLINLHPKYIDLSLGRLNSLLKKLGNPHLQLPPTIHIAGTNGKGSTLSFLRYILMENNLKVHTYISPHLKLFNERIILKNKQITNKKLLDALIYVKKINKKKPITFFEITTAAAFYLFSKNKADILILETGLGGRLDATNVIKKSIIDIITPISIDHEDYLGKGILKITNEKLGIIKAEGTVIISKQKKIVSNHITKKFKKRKNELLSYNRDYKILKKNHNKFKLLYNDDVYSYNKPGLTGDHQIENASAAIAAILKMNEIGYSISKENINDGIKKVKWPARLEEGKLKNIKVYLDGAHNIDGAKQLLKYFKDKKINLWLIIGMLKNKNLQEYLKIIKPILLGVIAVPIPNEKNAFRPEEISKVCQQLKIKNYSKISINQANNFLYTKIKPKKILISGSLYLVGKVRNKYL